MKLRLEFIIAAFIGLVIYIPAAYGQASLTFSGGGGAPLSTTLQSSVTYTVTTSNCSANNLSPIFVFQAVGNPLQSQRSVTGTITFSISGGTPQSIVVEGSGFATGAVSANDLYLLGPEPGLSSGSTVVLSAGTVTTNNNVTNAKPANGSFTTFIADGNGVRCSSNGVAMMPTAASVSISGRVVTGSGRGLANALVYLTDQNGNIQVSRTRSFGYYRFEDVPAGQTAIVTVVSKRFQFAPQVLNLNEEATQLNFVGEELKKMF